MNIKINYLIKLTLEWKIILETSFKCGLRIGVFIYCEYFDLYTKILKIDLNRPKDRLFE